MSYLSIKDAVRTSLFSSKWRYRQARLPNLALWGLLPPNFPWHKAWVHNKLYLAGGVKLVEVLKPFIHLNYLVMETNVNNREESLTARCLLNIVPNLQELHIVINHPFIDENVTGTETNFWEDGCRDCQFTKLQLVRLPRITGTKHKLDFIEFILLSSPVLERMIVGATCKYVQMELLKKLLPLRRASGRAQIIC